MWICFLQDYQGRLTGDIHFHHKGQIVDLDPKMATALVKEGRAVEADDPQPAPDVAPKRAKSKKAE